MIHNTHAHTTSVASTTMMGPKTAATIMVATDIPPDCSASSVVVTVSVGTCGDSAKNVTLEINFMNGKNAYWHNMVYSEIFAGRNISPISPPALVDNNFIREFLSHVNDYIRIWRPLLHWQKFIQPNTSAIQTYKGSWIWRNFCPAKISYTIQSSQSAFIVCIIESIYVWGQGYVYCLLTNNDWFNERNVVFLPINA